MVHDHNPHEYPILLFPYSDRQHSETVAKFSAAIEFCTSLPSLRRVHKVVRLHEGRIPTPADLGTLDGLSDLSVFLGRQLDVQRPHVVVEVFDLFRPRDRNHVFALGHEPGQGQLSRRAALFVGERHDPVDEFEVLVEVVGGEPREGASDVVVVKVVQGPVLTREEPPAERAVRDDRHAQFPTSVQQSDLGGFQLRREGTVFDLNGRDGVDFVRPSKRLG